MRKGTLIYSVILLVILTGLVAFSPAGAETLTGSAQFDPRRINLGMPAPGTVTAEIHLLEIEEFKSVYKYINGSTVRLEDPLFPSYTYFGKGALVAVFDGDGVVNILWGKINHMGALPPNEKIWLTITGNLNSTTPAPYGGAPFSVQGYIKVTLPYIPPPP